jgi:uncharacterized protein YdbL (DUF1318 family)
MAGVAQLAMAVPFKDSGKQAYYDELASSRRAPVHFPPGYKGDADAAWHLQHIFGDSGRIKFRGYFKRDLGGKRFYKMTHSMPHGHAMEDAIKREFGDYKKFKMPEKPPADFKPHRRKSVFKKEWAAMQAMQRRQQLAHSLEVERAKQEMAHRVGSKRSGYPGEVKKDKKLKAHAANQAKEISRLRETVEALTSQLTSVKQKVTNALKLRKARPTMLADQGSHSSKGRHGADPSKALSDWLSTHTLQSKTPEEDDDYATESQLMQEKYGEAPHADSAPLKKHHESLEQRQKELLDKVESES